MRILTQEERQKYQFQGSANYALLDKSTDRIFLESDTLRSCKDALKRMTVNHPRYKTTELVQINEEVPEKYR